MMFTTNRDLFERQRNGGFRADLLHRLMGIALHIPPLRERREDITFLATLFLEDCRAAMQTQRLRWSPAALRLLSSYNWPGNVRELKKIVQVAAYLHTSTDPIGEREIAHLLSRNIPARTEAAPRDVTSLADTRNSAERDVIANALQMTAGNRARAARLLKIGRRTLHEKIARYGL